VTERWGGAQILVNNTGMSPVAPSSLETTQELFDKIVAVNLRAAFRLCALFGAQMRSSGGGAIVNISSSGSLRPQPGFAPYAAAKAGLNVLTATFAKELGPTVRVNTVMPGPFHTDASKAWSRSEGFARYAESALPLRRAGEPPEIVGAVLYLLSDLASFTTGACLTVDGGQSIA
jgi:NAD(P)-dependent dehydrogenase (short-subunit alcohol dehydrogenase family)